MVVFATLHRLLGVGIGEHLGYLLTGLWTILVSASTLSTSGIWPWLGWIGLPIGAALVVGSLEFVGSNEEAGMVRCRHHCPHCVYRLVPVARGRRCRAHLVA